MDAKEIAARRSKRLPSNLSVSYGKAPLHIVRGEGQYLFDADGTRYLDATNNVAHVGHSHPAVLKAATEQLQLLNTNTRYLQSGLVEYAEALCATFPKGSPLREEGVVYFVTSGSAANDLAM